MRSPTTPATRFRRQAHRWFEALNARFAKARLHGQLARLARAEAEVIACTYCAPIPGMPAERACSREHSVREVDATLPKHPADLTRTEREQIAHLDHLADAAYENMRRLAPEANGRPFYDFIMGVPEGAS